MAGDVPSAPDEPVADEIRNRVDAARERLGRALREHASATAAVRTFSRAMRDEVGAQVDAAGPAPAPGATLLAVGALGRGELTPYADLDLVLLVPAPAGAPGTTPPEVPGPPDPTTAPDSESDEALRRWLDRWTHPLWDAGLSLQLAVRSPDEWLDDAAEDLRACTSLLDAEVLRGPEAPAAALRAAAAARYFGSAREPFLRRLAAEVDARHARYGATVYRVEPDLKHGAGGTRDLAVVAWSLRATVAVDGVPPSPSQADLDELLERGPVRPRVAQALREARAQLLRLRAGLHLVAGRATDRLSFADQLELPVRLGITAPADAPGEPAVAAAEAMMRTYYGAARDVVRYGRRACQACLPPRPLPPITCPIDDDFRVRDGKLEIVAPARLQQDPPLALRALALAQDEGVPLSGDLFDAIAEVAAGPAAAALAHDPQAPRLFLDLLAAPGHAGAEGLALCNELGVLEALIPEFEPVRALMQHEGLHAYTVDQHSVSAVGFLHDLARGEHRKDLPLATALRLELSDPRPLLLATLLHDVGKGIDPPRQCEAGAPVARRVATRLGLDATAAERVAFLVRHHDRMPQLSQRRDLTDPALVTRFAQGIPSPQALHELYLLSLADMHEVRPGFLTDWKRTLLDELYLRTLQALTQAPASPSTARGRHTLQGLPERYYTSFDEDLRRRHARWVAAVAAGRTPIQVEIVPAAGALRLSVVTRDASGLLACVTATLDDHGLEILAADVFSVPGPPAVALDVFRVRPRAGAGEAGPALADLAGLEDALAACTRSGGLEDLPPLQRPFGRASRIAPRVSFEDDPHGDATIVEVETFDAPGVLRRITAQLARHDLQIRLARCNTEAERVHDVFYTDPIPEDLRPALAAALTRALGG